MRFFKIVAVFTATVLTTANPLPQESLFSDLPDLSFNLYNFADPLGDSTVDLLEDSTLSASAVEGPNTFDSVALDGSDGPSLFTQDFSIADDFCSPPNGPVRKRNNMKCDSSPSKSPFINIPQLPNLLNLESPELQQSQTEDGSFIEPLPPAFNSLPADDSVTTKWRLDHGECLEFPYLKNLCCSGPWEGILPGIKGTVYSEIRQCFFSEYILGYLFCDCESR